MIGISQLGKSFGGRTLFEGVSLQLNAGSRYGLVGANGFRGRDSIFSGPAGGVVGMTDTARESGFERVVGFDMGGTSTDVSVHADGFERTSATIVGGVRIVAPMLRINTVAAGGGSILKFAGGRLQVGPESAGAQPGPACYRNGGPLTVTDANVLLGRIQPDHFPRVFGLNGDELEAEGFFLASAIDDDGERFRRLAIEEGPLEVGGVGDRGIADPQHDIAGLEPCGRRG